MQNSYQIIIVFAKDPSAEADGKRRQAKASDHFFQSGEIQFGISFAWW